MSPMPGTSTLNDVELVSVGTWAASTGVTTVTRADLDSMLAAAADGLVDHAPVKLGHTSSLNNGINDGNPAYGWMVPTRIGVNAAGNETIYGNLVGMPSKLAAVAPAAYRRRSVEIAWGVKTPGGKTYPAVLTAIALLGSAPPAVKGLADLLALYSAEPEAVERTERLEVVDGLEANPVAVAMLTAARMAGATIESIDAMAAAAGARDTADVPPPVEDVDHAGPNATAGQAGTTTGRTTMTDEELRAALALEADADIDAELARLIAERGTGANGTAGAASPGGDGQGGSGGQTGDAGTAGQGNGTTGTGSQGAGTDAAREPELATLSAAVLTELQTEAAWARNERRRQVLDAAVIGGRISPAERGSLTSELTAGQTQAATSFAAALERDEAGTTALLSGLAQRFAVSELGADAAPHVQAQAEAESKAYDDFEAQTFGLKRS